MSVAPHPYKTNRAQIVVGVQDDQGADVAPTRHPGLMKGGQELADPEVNWIEERVIGGNRDPFQHIEGKHAYEGGNWNVVPYDGWPIAFVLGKDSYDGTAGTHTITRKQEDPPPTVTVEGSYFGSGSQPDFSRAIYGVAANSGTITINNEDELTMSVDTMGLGLTGDTTDGSRTPTTVTLPDRRPWTFNKVSSNLSMAGTSFARVTNWELQIQNNPSGYHYLESENEHDPYEMLYGNGDYSLTVEVAITDDGLYQELAQPQSGGFTTTISLTKDSGDSITLETENSRIRAASPTFPDEGTVKQQLEMNPNGATITVDDSSSSAAYV